MRRLFLLLSCLIAMPALAQQMPRPGSFPNGLPGFPPGVLPGVPQPVQPVQQQRPGVPPSAQPPQAQGGPERIVTVQNRTTQAVTSLFVSPSTDDNWGSNRLTIPNIGPQRSFQLRLPGRDCKFDVQVVYADTRVEEKREQDICRNRQITFDGSEARLPGRERTLALMNRSPRSIKEVLISPRNTNSWGNNLLQRGEVDTGDDIDLVFRGPCVNDLRIVFDNDSAEERRGVDLCERSTAYIAPGWTLTDEMPMSATDLPTAAAAAAPAASGQAFTVINDTGTTINEIYIFPEGARAEGRDLLGSDTLDAGQRVEVRVERGDKCTFVLRAVFDGPRDDLRQTDLDLCSETEIRLSGGATPAPRGSAGAPSRRPGAEGPIPAGMVRLRNNAQAEVVAVFADPVGTERGLDRLGDVTLRNGEAFDLAPPVAGQCQYQIVALYRDGRRMEDKADLCRGGEVILP